MVKSNTFKKINYLNKDKKQKSEEIYFKNCLYHRDKGPAYIRYYCELPNKVYAKYYYNMGNLHRVDGPAVIYFNWKGEVTKKFYYLNHNKIMAYSDKEFKKIVKLMVFK